MGLAQILRNPGGMSSSVGNPPADGARVVVMGLGISGLWVTRWLVNQGADVVVTDVKPAAELKPEYRSELNQLGVRLAAGGHESSLFDDAEMIILSPGVPHDTRVLRTAAERGAVVMGELELASRLVDTPILAVTGTNGKSTVTALLGFVIETAGFEVFVGGNIGTPLMAYAAGEKRADFAVVEVSSFQLDTIECFQPFVSVILNISPDHLDRYSGYEAYAESKMRIFENQGSDGHLVLNDDDERLAGITADPGLRVLRYGRERKDRRRAFLEDNCIIIRQPNGKEDRVPVESVGLPGTHNLENLMAVSLCAAALGIDLKVVRQCAAEFQALPNRLEWVASLAGVDFYNDSKATNVDAAVRAVNSFDRPLVLIAGGLHKGADYAPLVDAARGKVKAAVLMGQARGLLAEALEGRVVFDEARDMEEAVAKAFSRAAHGDIVLLAPACASFDMYRDYSERGEDFRNAVGRMIHGS